MFHNSCVSAWLFMAMIFCAAKCFADAPRFDIPSVADPATSAPPSASGKPAILEGVGIEQRLGQQLPADTPLIDETGKLVHLGDFFGNRPLLLAFVQYRCPMLCTQVLNAQCRAMNACPLEPGRDYDILTISFDARETSALSAVKKHLYESQVQRPMVHQSWHFLTGDAQSIATITKAAGFHFTYDARLDQFIHASGIMAVTPDGRMSKYLYGIEYSPRDIQLALTTARQERAGTLSDAVLLYCFHYDPIQGRYTLAVTRLLAISAGASILVLGSFVAFELSSERKRRVLPANGSANA